MHSTDKVMKYLAHQYLTARIEFLAFQHGHFSPALAFWQFGVNKNYRDKNHKSSNRGAIYVPYSQHHVLCPLNLFLLPRKSHSLLLLLLTKCFFNKIRFLAF
jgi:hypothetical protein